MDSLEVILGIITGAMLGLMAFAVIYFSSDKFRTCLGVIKEDIPRDVTPVTEPVAGSSVTVPSVPTAPATSVLTAQTEAEAEAEAIRKAKIQSIVPTFKMNQDVQMFIDSFFKKAEQEAEEQKAEETAGGGDLIQDIDKNIKNIQSEFQNDGTYEHRSSLNHLDLWAIEHLYITQTLNPENTDAEKDWQLMHETVLQYNHIQEWEKWKVLCTIKYEHDQDPEVQKVLDDFLRLTLDDNPTLELVPDLYTRRGVLFSYLSDSTIEISERQKMLNKYFELMAELAIRKGDDIVNDWYQPLEFLFYTFMAFSDTKVNHYPNFQTAMDIFSGSLSAEDIAME